MEDCCLVVATVESDDFDGDVFVVGAPAMKKFAGWSLDVVEPEMLKRLVCDEDDSVFAVDLL